MPRGRQSSVVAPVVSLIELLMLGGAADAADDARGIAGAVVASRHQVGYCDGNGGIFGGVGAGAADDAGVAAAEGDGAILSDVRARRELRLMMMLLLLMMMLVGLKGRQQLLKVRASGPVLGGLLLLGRR